MTKIKVKKKEYELKLITMDVRCEILDKAMKGSQQQSFTQFVDIIRIATTITDDELMSMTTEHISAIALEIVEHCNAGKKSVKSK